MSRLSVFGWCFVVEYVGEGTESTVASLTFALGKKGTKNLTFGFDDNIY